MNTHSFLLYILITSSFSFGVNNLEAQTVSQFDIEITGTAQDIDVRFGNGAGFTTGLDVGYDAGYIFTGVPANPEDDVLGGTTGVYTLLVEDTLNQGVAFMIQTLPYADIGDMDIPLGVNIAADGSETISLENISAFPAGHRIILEDRNLGVFTELQGATDSYTAPLTAVEPEKGRFFLHTTNDTTPPTGPGSLTEPISPTNDTNADIVGLCGTDVPNGSVKITTSPVNGFSNNYDTTVRLDANGDFTITDPNWNEGSYSINFSCIDKVGNGPTAMGPFGPIEIDITPPTTPTTPDLQSGSDTGTTNTDNNTSDNTPTFDVTCTESDSTITLYANGVSAGTHTCTAIGPASITASPLLIDNTYDFTISETDLAGNESPQSSALSVVIDTTIDPVTINTPTTGSPLSGTADANSTVTITTPSGATCNTTTDATGNYTCTLAPSPVDGEDITATTTDIYGNTANTTEVGGIDVNAPTTPVITPVTAGDTSITGTGENGTTITLDIATCTNAPVVVAGGVWSCDLNPNNAPNHGDGIVATSTDLAGNYSTGRYYIPRPKSGSKRLTESQIKNIFNKKEIVDEEKVSVNDNDSALIIAEIIEDTPINEDKDNCVINYSRMLKKGIFGEDVYQVQHCISSYGHQVGPLDGIFGEWTYLGVLSYQRKYDLLQDGIVGSETLQHLKNNF